MSETPVSILGARVYELLQMTLPQLLTTDRLNSEHMYQNPRVGAIMSFSHTTGNPLTSTQWLLTKDAATEYFTELKNSLSIDSAEYEAVTVAFIEPSDGKSGKIVIKSVLH